MGCRVCPDCGAYLDAGEICDCAEKEKAASGGANTEDGKQNKLSAMVAQNGGKFNG